VSSIQGDSTKAEVAFVPDLLDGVMTEIDENNRKGVMIGNDTGFEQLNNYLAGWQRQRYFVLGARPKMGKTSFFCQLADKASESFPVLIFSMEMSKNSIVKLLLFQRAKVDSMDEQHGRLKSEDFEILSQVYSDMYSNILFIDDKSRTITEMKASIRKVKKDLVKMGKEPWIGLIVVDYLQLMKGDNRLTRNYQLEEISRELMAIKKAEDTTILSISQMDRSVDERRDPRPLPGDLKDTGAFEQDCDGVMLMYRDAYYHGRNNKNSKTHLINGNEVVADAVEINMYLNRFGPAGVMKYEMFTSYRLFAEPKEEDVIVDAPKPKTNKTKDGKSRVVQTRIC
jgi:replicative DNA helicase